MPSSNPVLGFSDAVRGGTDPDDGRHIDHTPKAVAGIMLVTLAFLYLFHEKAGFRVVIGAGRT